MRNVISISLPAQMQKLVKKQVSLGRYASASEFFRDLLRDWSEDSLYRDVIQSQKEFAEGKGKKLRSLKDLR